MEVLVEQYLPVDKVKNLLNKPAARCLVAQLGLEWIVRLVMVCLSPLAVNLCSVIICG